MALLFMDGCAHYGSITDVLRKWTYSYASGVTVGLTSGRRGGPALVGSSSFYNLSKTVAPGSNTTITGFAMKFTSAGSTRRGIWGCGEGTATQMMLIYDGATGLLSMWRGGYVATLATGTLPLALNTWYYIEVKATIDNTVGAYTVRVNGVVELTQSGIDTQNNTTATVNRLVLGEIQEASGGAPYVVCDIYMCDSTGTSHNDFLGDVRIDTLFPNADGTYSQFATSTGTSHFALVDEAVPSTTDYVSSGVVGNKDSYGLTDLTTSAAVLAIQVCNLMYKDDAGARSGANLIRSGTTDLQTASVALSASPLYNLSIHQTDPATGVAWTQAGVNAMQVGPVVAA